jgi:Putative DNA-binding domain
MKLSDFQALFQGRILAGPGAEDAPLLAALRESDKGAARDELLQVYQSGYRLRLEGFLYEDHPGLLELIGDDAFEMLARDYVEANPPTNRNARWYTTGLPEYMQAHPRWREEAKALSMAFFERAMVNAFDAPDAEPLTIQALAAFAPEDSPRFVFAFHPSLVVLELAAGTLAAYAGPGDDETPPEASSEPMPEGGVETVAIWRRHDETAYRELEPDEFLALNEARDRRAFGDICQMAAFQRSGEIEPERLAQFLASWFEDGMVVGVSLQN